MLPKHRTVFFVAASTLNGFWAEQKCRFRSGSISSENDPGANAKPARKVAIAWTQDRSGCSTDNSNLKSMTGGVGKEGENGAAGCKRRLIRASKERKTVHGREKRSRWEESTKHRKE